MRRLLYRPAMIRISSTDRGQTGRTASTEFLDKVTPRRGVLHPPLSLVACLDKQVGIIYQIGQFEFRNAGLAGPCQFAGASQSKIGFGKPETVPTGGDSPDPLIRRVADPVRRH